MDATMCLTRSFGMMSCSTAWLPMSPVNALCIDASL